MFAGAPADLTKVIRSAAELNWHPVFMLNHMSSSIATVLKPAGQEKALGVITATFLKDANDPAWKGEQAVKDWQTFIEKYKQAGGNDDSAAMFGYASAETLAQVLKQCGNDLSRDNVMKQAAALEDYQGSILLPGIKINTGRWDFRPIKHLRLVQFDGRSWQPIGDVLETAFYPARKIAASGPKHRTAIPDLASEKRTTDNPVRRRSGVHAPHPYAASCCSGAQANSG